MGSRPITIQDGKIHGEVEIGPASISADVDPNNPDAATVGMGSSGIVPGGNPLLPGGGEVSTEISISGEGIDIKGGLDSKNTGLGGEIGVDISPGGDKASVDASVGYGSQEIISVQVVKDGCTITVDYQLFGGQSVTNTFTDPKCKQPELPPSPSPSPTPTPTPSPIYPANTFIHVIQLQTLYFGQPSGMTLEIIEGENNRYKVKSTYVQISGTYVQGHTSSGTFNLSGPITESFPSSYYTAQNALFESAAGFSKCAYFGTRYTSPIVSQGTLRLFIILFAGMSEEVAKMNLSGSVYQYYVLPCESTKTPPNWNSPPMAQDKCCNASTSMMRRIMKVLAVEEIEKNGIKVPAEFLAQGGTGQIKVDDYGELILNLYRTVNRYGIDTPIVVKIKDVNKAKAGDQSVEIQLNSPAAAIQALVELAVENKGDAATRLQIQVRLIYAVTRTLKMVAGIGETVREIIKMLGSPFKWTTMILPLEFDLTAGIKSTPKGFDPKDKKNKQQESTQDGLAPGLEANNEDTTESLLPAILTPTKYNLPVPKFVQSQDDLQDLLVKIILLLSKKK